MTTELVCAVVLTGMLGSAAIVVAMLGNTKPEPEPAPLPKAKAPGQCNCCLHLGGGWRLNLKPTGKLLAPAFGIQSPTELYLLWDPRERCSHGLTGRTSPLSAWKFVGLN
jgi:hypothetical protein